MRPYSIREGQQMKVSKLKQPFLTLVFLALTAGTAQLVIPKAPVPFSFLTVGVCLAGAFLKKQYALLCMVAYLVLGFFGFPVFSGFSSGLHKLLGPTGGYLLACPLAAVLIALLVERWGKSFRKCCLAMGCGQVLCYIVGVSQLVSVAHLSVWDGLVKGLLPFILFDAAKILLCAGIAAAVHKRVEAKQHTGHPVKSRQAL